MTNLPIIVCFVLGIGLLIVEALMPGFGIAGFSGIVLEVVALVLTWQQHGTMATLGMLLIVLSVLAIAISTSLHSLTKGKLSKSSIVNSHTESTDAGYRSAETHKQVLENPDLISRTVLSKGLDAGTAYEILSIDIADVDVGRNIGAQLMMDQAESDRRVAQAKAEERRAMAVAHEQEMKAAVQEMRAKVVEAEAEVPKAMAAALREGKLGVMDYYQMQNTIADTSMRDSIAKASAPQSTPTHSLEKK